MSHTIRIDCVVVTYNKLDLLKECLQSLLMQTIGIQNIFVVNNNSSVETKDYLTDLSNRVKIVKPINLRKNIGGAGGFNRGIREFMEKSDSDYVWIMDDDTIAHNDSLEKLVQSLSCLDNVGFLASNVRWIDGTPAIMNTPALADVWNEKADTGLLGIKTASFVSLLVSRTAVKSVGLPIKDFFIWNDDTEFTTRIFKKGFNNYMVVKSCVTHKMAQNVGINIIKEHIRARIKRYYLRNRNAIFMFRENYGCVSTVKEIIRQLITVIDVIFKKTDFKILKIVTLLRGTIAGLFFSPKIEKIDD